MTDIQIRKIKSTDNKIIAQIIRQVLKEFNLNKPGYAWQDPELDDLHSAYNNTNSIYYIVTLDNKIIGGAGIMPITGFDNTCELTKLYLLPTARGHGIGKSLIEKLIEDAKNKGYKACYLETSSCLNQSIKLYNMFGFKEIKNRVGDSRHCGCDKFYLLAL